MLTVTFKVFEPALGKSFVNVKEAATMADFRLYATSLWSGRWEILSVE